MSKIAVVTDSNAGMTKEDAKENGVFVVPMPFTINGAPYLEGITLSQEEFYRKLADGADVSTSMPSLGDVEDMFTDILKTHDEIVYLPMSSGLSSSCHAAKTFFEDEDSEFYGKVFVVDNKRISVTLRQSVLDAVRMAAMGKSAAEIRQILEKDASNSSIYIMLNTLYYLKKGGRITPAAAAIGTILRIKPVLQIQGDKLDAFAKARTEGHGKKIMLNAVSEDAFKKYGPITPENLIIAASYTYDSEAAFAWKKEIESEFPGMIVHMDPLSLSISCHIGPGALAITVTRRLRFDDDGNYIENTYMSKQAQALAEKEAKKAAAVSEKEAQKAAALSEKEAKKAAALAEKERKAAEAKAKKEEERRKKIAQREVKRRETEAWKDVNKNN